jgi:hypothetical protein
MGKARHLSIDNAKGNFFLPDIIIDKCLATAIPIDDSGTLSLKFQKNSPTVL